MNVREVGLRLPLPASTGSMDTAARGGGVEFTLPVVPERAPARVASTPTRAEVTQAEKARADRHRIADEDPAARASERHNAEPTAETPVTADTRHKAAGNSRRDDQRAPDRASAGSGITDLIASAPSPDAIAPGLGPGAEARTGLTDAGTAPGSAEAAPPAVAMPATWLVGGTPAVVTAASMSAATALPAAAGATAAAAGAGTGVAAGAGPAPAPPMAGMPVPPVPSLVPDAASATPSPPPAAPLHGDLQGSPPANAAAAGAAGVALVPGLPAASGVATAAPRPSPGSAPHSAMTPSAQADAPRTSGAPSSGLDPAALLLATDTTSAAAASAARGALPALPAVAPSAAGPEAFAALVALSTQAGHAAPTDERAGDALSALTGLDAAPPAPATAALSGPAPLRLEPAAVVVPGTVALPASPEAGFDDALGEKVVWIVEQRLAQAEMRVSPDGLGSIEVRLQLDGHKLSAQFNAAHPDVRQALEAGMGRLRDLLGQHGMELADSHVGQQHGGGDRPPSRQARGEDADGERPPLVTTLGGLRARGLIDLYA